MEEKAKQIFEKIKNWWKKFDRRQKGILLSAMSVVLIMVLILVLVLNHTTYEVLKECEDTYTASEIVTILDENGIAYRTSTDGMTVEVASEDLGTANVLLGANNIESKSYEFENVVDSSFTTTEADKQRKMQKYAEGQMEEDLKKINTINSASVNFYIPESSGTLIANDEASYAAIYLDVTSDFKQSTAEAIAKMAAFYLGNDNTDTISIMDTNGKLIYPKVSPEDSDEVTMMDVSNQMAFTSDMEELVKKEVKDVVLGTGQYENVSVSARLSIDFDEVKNTLHEYIAAEGQQQGLLSHEDYYQANNVVGGDSSAAVPGTDSNNENGTTYPISEDDGTQSSNELQYSKDYLPSESITERKNAMGTIVKEDSTISLSAYSYHVYKQEDVEIAGLLEGTTWEEFKVAHAAKEKLEVDEDLFTLVAYAAGVPVENVAITAYEEPVFYDKVTISNISASDIIVIVLTVLIVLLLGFVVWKTVAGDRKKKQDIPQEEELSVESMLQTEAGDMQIADIETETKSETRLMIEKFVDDNPEAAAILLRNWLEEEWGV